ncbi:MAG: DUF2973 domain-containing protein [Microcoleus vaginatus WJT46-NPBG5]|nr:DUF2973 domain-containing protein [Microcoleus vaginatus WJT46-NPBG5]
MLHLLYILAFTTLAFLAVGNLIRSLISLSAESQRPYSPISGSPAARYRATPHPELLDSNGKVVNEPLMVMKSMTVEDAREHLDALYNSSPGSPNEARDDA